ncbi:hypothetical protein AB42_4533 [Escherichia coli 1-392-07_S1_C2]|nr:hypothetical protein AC80_0420 [Escherichia coli 1-110-08_S4_C1]KDW79429.1 hypothetical protein AB42_4533 [Escherichia coli 1-392-07_S1_C2]
MSDKRHIDHLVIHQRNWGGHKNLLRMLLISAGVDDENNAPPSPA